MVEDRPPRQENAGGWRMLDADQVRALARRLIDAEPLLHRARPAEILTRLGWRPPAEGDSSRRVVLTDSGLGLEGWSGKVWLDPEDDGRAESISACVCDIIRPFRPGMDDFLQDVFALATRALAEAYGPPTEVEPGEQPEVRWRMDVLTLSLAEDPNTVELILERNSDLAKREEMARYEQP